MSNKQPEQVEVSCKVVHETKAALCVYHNGVESWIPLSQVHYINKQAGIIRITPWIAKQKGFV